ncbi:polysaccharide biosynthesis/export family protein [Oleidesulfovibrio sp.]|uniref:polysaccharide biosynthesis/export family protein n=1 Tax=Oleidesulfovibrio sp. TaxID=2909707 RepID=UPI003A8C78DE
MKRNLLSVLLAVVVLTCAVPAVSAMDEYVIGSGDGLLVNVWGESDLNVAIAVRPDGRITVPGIGDVMAQGKTPTQLTAEMTKKLSELVRNPIVTVSVTAVRNNAVTIHGAGVQANVVPLERSTTLLELLAQLAPGDTADFDQAYLSRGGKQVVSGFTELFVKGDTSQDVELLPGDRIYIPYRADRNVFVMGAVNSPMAIPHHEGLSVLEALLAAGSFNKFADRNNTVIVRQEGKVKKSIPVKGGDLVNEGDLSQNLALQPGDYVIVKKSFF